MNIVDPFPIRRKRPAPQRVAGDIAAVRFPAPAACGLAHLYGVSFYLKERSAPLPGTGPRNVLEPRLVVDHGFLRLFVTDGRQERDMLRCSLLDVPIAAPWTTDEPVYYDMTVVGVPCGTFGLEAEVGFVDTFPEGGPPALWKDVPGEAFLGLTYHGKPGEWSGSAP